MRTALALAAAAVLAALVWLSLAREPRGTAVAPPTPAPEASPPVESEAALTELANAREAVAGPDETQTAPDAASAPSNEELGVLRIVAAEDDAPLAGARVHVVELEPSQRRSWFPNELDAAGFERVEREVEPRISDEHGQVLLARVATTRIAVARHGERFGWLWCDPSQLPPWTLELAPSPDWIVRVRDVSGQPIAGLPIDVHVDGWGARASAETDAAGIARFEQAALAAASGATQVRQFVPRAILREPVFARVSLAEPPAGMLELELPELGEIELVLLDPDGRPSPMPRLSLWLREASGLRSAQRPERQEIARFDTSRHIHRMLVGLGLGLEAGLGAGNLDEEFLVRRDGPTRRGDLLRIELRAGAEHPIARMRLLGPDAVPLASTFVHVEWRAFEHDVRNRSTMGQFATNENAVLEIPLPKQRADLTTLIAIRLPEDASAQAALVVPSEAERGWLDFGDVQLTAGAVIAAGRVVDEAGAPVAGARVAVRAIPTAMSAHSKTLRDERGRRPRYEHESLHATKWSIEADAQGAFELRSSESVEHVWVCAFVGDVPPQEGNFVEGAPGRSDYVLVAPAECAAHGRVLVPQSARPSSLTLELSFGRKGSDAPRIEPNGTWRSRSLRPGTWTIDVRRGGDFASAPLLTTQFEAVAGQDVRVPDLDLSALRVIDIELVDERGEPLDGTCTFMTPEGQQRGTFAVKRGQASLKTMDARIDASFDSPGRRRVQVADLQGGARIELVRGWPVRVRLADARVLPDSPYELVASFAGAGDDRAFDAAGEVLLHAPLVGEQAIRIYVRDPRRDDPQQYRVVVGDWNAPHPVIVADQAEEQKLELELDAQLVTEAAQKLALR